MTDEGSAANLPRTPVRFHVIVNPALLLTGNAAQPPRTFDTREAAQSECNRLNGGAGRQAFLVIETAG